MGAGGLDLRLVCASVSQACAAAAAAAAAGSLCDSCVWLLQWPISAVVVVGATYPCAAPRMLSAALAAELRREAETLLFLVFSRDGSAFEVCC